MTWKYQIGDVLVHRATLLEPVPDSNVRLYVTNRVSVECPGGVQQFYDCRLVSVGRGVGLGDEGVRLLEDELAPYAEYAALAQAQAEADAATEEKRYPWRILKERS